MRTAADGFVHVAIRGGLVEDRGFALVALALPQEGPRCPTNLDAAGIGFSRHKLETSLALPGDWVVSW
jgi:hypothetical protein